MSQQLQQSHNHRSQQMDGGQQNVNGPVVQRSDSAMAQYKDTNLNEPSGMQSFPNSSSNNNGADMSSHSTRSSSIVGGTGIPDSYLYSGEYPANQNMFVNPSNTQTVSMMNNQFSTQMNQPNAIVRSMPMQMLMPPVSDTSKKTTTNHTIAQLLRDDLTSCGDDAISTSKVFMRIADKLSSKEMGGDKTAVLNNRAEFVQLGGHLATAGKMKMFKSNPSVQIMGCRVIQNSVVGMHHGVRKNAILVGCMNEIIEALCSFPGNLSLQSSGCAALETLIRDADHLEQFNEYTGIMLISTILKSYWDQFDHFLQNGTVSKGTDRQTNDTGSAASSYTSTTGTNKPKNSGSNQKPEQGSNLEKESTSKVVNLMQIMKKCCCIIGFASRYDKFIPVLWKVEAFLVLSNVVQDTIDTSPAYLNDYRDTLADTRQNASEAMINMLAHLRVQTTPGMDSRNNNNINKRKLGQDMLDGFMPESMDPKRLQMQNNDVAFSNQQFVHDNKPRMNQQQQQQHGLVGLPEHFNQFSDPQLRQQQQQQQQQQPNQPIPMYQPSNQDRRGNYGKDL